MQTQNKSIGNNREYFDIVMFYKECIKHIWMILLGGVLGTVIAAASILFLVPPMYSSDIMFYVNNISANNVSSSGYISTTELAAAQNLASTYMVILKTENTMNAILEDSGLDYTYEQLSSMITTASVDDTEIFQVTVTCANPEDACRLTRSIETVLPETVEKIVYGSSM